MRKRRRERGRKTKGETTEIRIARGGENKRPDEEESVYKRIRDGRGRRNKDREGNEGSEGKATNSVTASPVRPN